MLFKSKSVQILFALSALFFCAQPKLASAHVSPISTVQGLRDICEIPNAYSQGICIYYIEAVFEAQTYLSSLGTLRPLKGSKGGAFCAHPTSGVTLGQAEQVFVNWTNRFPQFWQGSAAVGVMAAFAMAWPCK